MEQINELAKFVTESRGKKISLIDFESRDSKDNYRKIAERIGNGNITTESEISQVIEVAEGSPGFRMFKSRFKEKLLNNVLLFDIKGEDRTPYHKAIMQCWRNVYCIKVLSILGMINSAKGLAKSTYKKAIEFELYEVAFTCARELRRFGSYSGSEDKFNRYNQEAKESARLNYAENMAFACLESLYVKVANTNFYKKELIGLAKEKLEEVTKIHEQSKTYLIGLFYYRVKVIYEELREDYAAALVTWGQFENYIQGYKHFEYAIRIAEIAVQEFYCYMCLGDYVSAQKCSEKCELYYKRFSGNWYLYKEYYFLLAMHNKKYTQATSTVQQIIAVPSFKFTQANRQEKWKLFEAYNYIMQRAVHEVDIDQNKAFNLAKFLNETPIYNKDKGGFNISVLIVQIMIFLLDKRFKELSEKFEALKRYSSRNFQKDTEYKSRIFVKMIIMADKCAYDYDKTSKATSKFYADLKKEPYRHSNSYEGLEIVPYAHLWEVVLDCLK